MIYTDWFTSWFPEDEERIAPIVYKHNSLSEETINNIINFGESLDIDDAQVGVGADSMTNDEVRKTKVAFFNYGVEEHRWVFNDIINLINEGCSFFDEEVDNLPSLQFTVYGNESHYDWHIDRLVDLENGIRRVSFVILLTDPSEFEGGELEFNLKNSIYTLPLEKGSIIFFTADTLHRVKPVTKGKRITLVGWIYYSNFYDYLEKLIKKKELADKNEYYSTRVH